jgi:hypothetical protein
VAPRQRRHSGQPASLLPRSRRGLQRQPRPRLSPASHVHRDGLGPDHPQSGSRSGRLRIHRGEIRQYPLAVAAGQRGRRCRSRCGALFPVPALRFAAHRAARRRRLVVQSRHAPRIVRLAPVGQLARWSVAAGDGLRAGGKTSRRLCRRGSPRRGRRTAQGPVPSGRRLVPAGDCRSRLVARSLATPGTSRSTCRTPSALRRSPPCPSAPSP